MYSSTVSFFRHYRQLASSSDSGVTVSAFAIILLLHITASGFQLASSEQRDLPFLPTDNDPALTCANAFRYEPLSANEETKSAVPPTQRPTPTTATRKTGAAGSGDGAFSETNGASPVKITVNSTIYTPRQRLLVTVSSPIPFRGYLLHARRLSQSNVVGQFIVYPTGIDDVTSVQDGIDGGGSQLEDDYESPTSTTSGVRTTIHESTQSSSASNLYNGVRSVNCDGIQDTLVAWHKNGALTYNESFIWIAPNDDVGPILFVGTFFVDERRYWTNVTSPVLRKGFLPIDFSSCGKTKGCFRYANAGETTCDSRSCIYALTYQVTDNTARFELTAAASWVAVGFSSDEKMGGDDVFLCSRSRMGGNGPVRNYYTEIEYVTPTLKAENPLYDAEFEETAEPVQVGGRSQLQLMADDASSNDLVRVSCRFSRPLKVMFDQNAVDLSNTWYQLYAWGSLSLSGDAINRHTLDKPPTSDNKLTLRHLRNDIISGVNSSLRHRTFGYLAVSLLTTAIFVFATGSTSTTRQQFD